MKNRIESLGNGDFRVVPLDDPEFIEFQRSRNMRTFDTFEQVEGMNPCMKRPIVVHAKPIPYDFRVNTLEGDYKQGKAGDYLMRGIDGELYICDKEIFEKTYDFVK